MTQQETIDKCIALINPTERSTEELEGIAAWIEMQLRELQLKEKK